jgi:predicted RNA binding protein YcfA (HicA-like mRNA interferase family)
MSKFDKLKQRLLSKPKDFTFSELESLLNKLGYVKDSGGKTSGSKVAFVKEQHIISIHKPHPGNELKMYVVNYIIDELRKEGLL